MPWSSDELETIVEGDDLRVSPFREDGRTCGTPTWIWCVAVEGELYVRAYSGASSRWYQAAMSQKAGQIVAAGTRRDVFFEGVTGPINEHIDRAYRAKYQGSQCLKPMTGERCRSATVRITPDELRPPPPKRVVPGHSHRY